MPDEKVKVEWFPTSGGLNEIYQQTGMIFSFMTSPANGSKQCHQWVKCRDYLHDAVRTQNTGATSAIYGFRFEKDVNPAIDLKKMRMIVSKNGLKNDAEVTEFVAKMKRGLLLLNHFEKQSKIALSTLKVADEKGCGKKAAVIFTGSSVWMKSPFLVSMYTFLIRLGDKEMEFKNSAELKSEMKRIVDAAKAGGKSDNDISYLANMWNKLHTIMKNRTKLFTMKDGVHDVFWKGDAIHNFHNNCGILSLCSGNTPYPDLNKKVTELCAAEQPEKQAKA